MKKGFSVTVLALAMASAGAYSQAFAPKIGVMVWNKDITMGDVGSIDKLCILQTLTERTGVEFQIYENHKTLLESVEAARQMVSDGIELAILPTRSDETLAAVPVLKEAGIPYLTSATSDKVITSPDEGLSIFSRNQSQAETMAHFYLDNYAERPVDVVTDVNSQYSIQLSNRFISDLHLIDDSIPVTEHEVVSGSLNTLPNLSGHVVFSPMYNPDIALLYRKMRDDGNVILLGTDAVGAHNKFLDVAGRNEDNNGTKLIFLRNWDSQIHGNSTEDYRSVFYSQCSSLFKKPTFSSVYMFDLGSLAIEWALSDGKQAPLEMVKQSLLQSVVDGGRFQFTEHGYRKQALYFYEFSGGEKAIPLQQKKQTVMNTQ